MPVEQLTYAQIAERLAVSAEAARAIVKRNRLPRSRSNDGKTLAAIDLEEIRHKPLLARSPRGHRSVTDVVATLKARVAELEAELAQAEERSRGHRADFERERGRADRMVTAQDRLIVELEHLRSLLEAAQKPARHYTIPTARRARTFNSRTDDTGAVPREGYRERLFSNLLMVNDCRLHWPMPPGDLSRVSAHRNLVHRVTSFQERINRDGEVRVLMKGAPRCAYPRSL
jgi:hypothetical protein